jgi:D-glycero-D-manno-heptose 1,7-bisphosphate phosphatase
MLSEFKKNGIEFLDLKFCPHSPDDGCDCRKPSPKLILECITQYDINTSESFMIGDKVIDAECGEASGMSGVTLNCKVSSSFQDFKSLTEFADSL